jgi:hypothetical protein
MSQTVNENESLFLGPQTAGQAAPVPFSIRSLSSGDVEITSWKTLNVVATPTAGPQQKLRMGNTFVPISLEGPWKVSFPPNLGAPASAVFPKLTSWTESSDDGVKYFSGSATYRKSFTLPKEYTAKGNALRLNLGEVKNFATVRVNGKEVAVLWKPPFSLDVSAFVHAGVNDLDVKVTNLWPNRIIGDEQLPPDAEWEGMRLKRFPDWLVQGKPRPKTGRVTFSTYHYYDKNSPLLESGLLGPVTIEAAKKVVLSFK